MIRRMVVGLVVLILVVPASDISAPEVSAQNLGPATICSTHWGWCPLNPGWRLTAGIPCHCLAPSGQPLAGVTRHFDYAAYQRPVHPSLDPHWSDMPPPPPVIK
jgi:hypothetical protein